MNSEHITTATARIQWACDKAFAPPWLRYAPTIHVETCPELDARNISWTASVRRIDDNNDESQQFTVTFQIVAPRAPHHLLMPHLEFEFWEGKRVWHGIILETFMAPKDPNYWYDT